MPRLIGTAWEDLLEATDARPWVISGLAGDDFLYGADGDDKILGGVGHDELKGGIGNDLLRGGEGYDVLLGGEGADRLNGDGGDDTLSAGPGDDILIGATGDDTLLGGQGTDLLWGGKGNDYLQDLSIDWNELRGGMGDDTVVFDNGFGVGGPGSDRLQSQLVGARYAIQIGGEGADLFGLLTHNDGQLGLGHVADFDPAAGDRLSLTHLDAASGTVMGSAQMAAYLDSNHSGTLGDGDAAAVPGAEGNRLWLHIGDDVIAIDFANGAQPLLSVDFIV